MKRYLDWSDYCTETRLDDMAELDPWDLVVAFHREVRPVIRRVKDRQRYRCDAAVKVLSQRPRGEQPPLCACGCGEPVRSAMNRIWSRYRGNHWQRGPALK